ncbi:MULTISPECIES: hypothetical protein [Vibrio oreintalis group]|uniref:hypothetical protein n=1 Tax=Vibrio oreintalis group TaxID=1891919 RepID=UPI00234F7775|nr:hypothetical protein [Vibrio tubiashii]WCP70175.1 hypothetical protein LYZ37_23695 [Vibrio tubiashii]
MGAEVWGLSVLSMRCTPGVTEGGVVITGEKPFDFKAASETVAHICQRHPVASVLSIEHMEPELSVVA